MHRYFCLLFLLWGCSPVWATTDASAHPSPDGQFAIYNVGDTAQDNDYFEVRTKDGTVVYSSQNSVELELPTHASAIRWTSDSRFALLWVRQGKFDSTCIFCAEDRTLIHLALGEEDSYTVPVRWADRRTFVVEISGPHGHHAQVDMWHYRKTYRVTARPCRLECIATTRTVHNDNISFPRTPLLYITAPDQVHRSLNPMKDSGYKKLVPTNRRASDG